MIEEASLRLYFKKALPNMLAIRQAMWGSLNNDPRQDPAKFITEHYIAYAEYAKTHLGTDPGRNGRMFESIIWDALIKFEVNPDAIQRDTDITPPHQANVDILVNGSSVHCLMIKCSFRERWKQDDRTGLVWTLNNMRDQHYRFVQLCAYEKYKDRHSRDVNIQKCREYEQVVAGTHNVISMHDTVRIQNLFSACKKASYADFQHSDRQQRRPRGKRGKTLFTI